MAESDEVEVKEVSLGLDEVKLAELVKANVTSSMKDVIDALPKASEPKEEPKTDDFWDNIIDPKMNPKLAQANLRAESAEDKIDFYSSDEWLEESEEWLTEDDPIKRKAEKSALRASIETTFANLVKSGRGTKRADVFSYVLGEKVKKDRIKYQESIGKRHTKSRDSELDKARRGVDISTGNISNFTYADIYSMSMEKVVKEFGNLNF